MKKFILILILVFILFGCKKEEDHYSYKDAIDDFKEKYDDNTYLSLFYIYYDIDDNAKDELILLGYSEYEYKILDIYYYKDDNNAEELIDNSYYSKWSRVDVYDNGMLFVYHYISYDHGLYLIYKMEDNKINEVGKYYFKYITDDEYFIYDDEEFEIESKYLSVNDLLEEYIKNGKKINLKSLDLKGV